MLEIYEQVDKELQNSLTRILAESFTGETDIEELSETISTMYYDMVIESDTEKISVHQFLLEQLEVEEKILPRNAYLAAEVATKDGFYFVPQLDKWLWSPVPRY